MLAFTTLKSFLYLKFFKISTLNLAPTLIRKMIYTIYFFFLSLLFSLKLGSRSFHPFTFFRINHSSLPFSLSHSCLLSDSLSLSFVSFSTHRPHSFLLDIWYKRILRLENCLSTRRYRRSV